MKADASNVLTLLKTARGQIEGIIKMVEENRYCMDISSQLLACGAVIKKANGAVISAHMQSCVRGAIEAGGDSDKYVRELVELFSKLNG